MGGIDINKVLNIIQNRFEEFANEKAVVCGNDSITYSELDRMSDILSFHILKYTNGQNRAIALLFERSIDYVVTVFGILKAGAAFLPLSKEFSKERIEYILKDSCVEIIIANYELKMNNMRIINYKDLISDEVEMLSKNNIAADRTAYIIYTSGSTGRPKGVPITYDALFMFYSGFVPQVKYKSRKKILATSSFTFDISLVEIIVPILTGMCIILVGEKESKHPRYVCNIITKHRPDYFQMTPTYIKYLLTYKGDYQIFENAESIVVGGEKFPDKLLYDLQKINGLKIYNAYGPTEATIWVSVGDLTEASYVHVGKPINKMKFKILNENQCFPLSGELLISGPCLTNGYINGTELNNQKFEIIENLIFYHSGDIATYDISNNVVIKGRIDNQIKINGHRIELEEVENYILTHTNIDACIVLFMFDVLFCYYIANKSNISQLKENLLKYIPLYMIPKYFYKIKCLPTNTNGKVDRKMVGKMDCVLIKNEIFEVIQEIASCEVRADMSMLDLALDSLGYVNLIVKFEDKYQIEFDLFTLEFNYFKTINDLADYIISKVEVNKN